MSERNDGGPAFPHPIVNVDDDGNVVVVGAMGGMSLRDWFAGQALANPAICTGKASERDLELWDLWNASPGDIAARQAEEAADAILKARGSGQ